MDKHIAHSARHVSFLIPAFNEGKRIKKLVKTIVSLLKSHHYKKYEIILIDDGSADDNKRHFMDSLAKLPGVKIIEIDRNVGKGLALKTGFQYAQGEHIVFLDGDFQIHPRYAIKYLKVLNEGKADIVIASKRHRQSRVDYPKKRAIASTGYHKLCKLLFGIEITDTQTGLKVFNREVLDRVFPIVTSKLYAFDLEILLLAIKMGYKITERPIDIMEIAKFDRFSFDDVYHTFKDTMCIWYRYKIRKSYVFHSHYSERTERKS